MFQAIDAALAKSGPGIAMYTAPYLLVAYTITQIALSVLAAVVAVILAYGAVAGAIIGLLGPIFIPFLVIEKLEFLFWGWLKAFLSFSFYKVIAAATMSILGHLFMAYSTNLIDFTNPIKMLQNFPFIILLVVVNIFMIIKIPAITASIFSGSSSGHDAGMGVITGVITAGLMG
jgi:type IV secretory pathway VirB6-like protein